MESTNRASSPAQPRATLNDLVTAAVATYGNQYGPALNPSWQRMDIAPAGSPLEKNMQAKGFYGEAHINRTTGEVIIANRGTTVNLQNLVSDAQILFGLPNQAQPVANSFAASALFSAQTILSQSNVPLSAIYTTGHSLGGQSRKGRPHS